MQCAAHAQTLSLRPPLLLPARRPAAAAVAPAAPAAPAAVVSLRPQRWGLSTSQLDERASIGSLGLAALEALRSSDQQRQAENEPPPPPYGDSSESGGTPLKGSDVLWALQRATEEKKRKKRRPAKEGARPHIAAGAGEDFDYSKVRPIEVKEEWEGRIDELEKRVNELLSEYL